MQKFWSGNLLFHKMGRIHPAYLADAGLQPVSPQVIHLANAVSASPPYAQPLFMVLGSRRDQLGCTKPLASGLVAQLPPESSSRCRGPWKGLGCVRYGVHSSMPPQGNYV